jgi:hypothetical protein
MKTFDSPTGPLASVLDVFEKATGMTVDTARLQERPRPAPPAVSPSIRRFARFSPTTLTPQLVHAKTVLIDVAVAEFVEAAGRTAPRSPQPVLTEPLRDVEDTYGVHSVKLPHGHLVLYPSTSLHHVRPVTRGARICSFFWIQSMIRDDGQRTLLFDLDSAIQRIGPEPAQHTAVVQLTGVYHNLLRQWAEL